MDHAGPATVLPLRPHTVGEVLDAAVSLMRGYGRVLVPVAAVLALAEQLVLGPLRVAASADPPAYLPDLNLLGVYWLLLCVGAATEATIIAALGGLTSRAAGAAVLGHRLPARELLRLPGSRFGAVALVAGMVGVIMFGASLAGPVWVIGYALCGLAVPALVLDRVGPGGALGRGAVLAGRSGLRAGAIRVLGYLAWLAIRVGIGFGGIAALSLAGVDDPHWTGLISAAAWLVVNSIAYPTLACLDAVLLLETRMRTEGLDILLSRARRHGPLTPALLATR